MGKSTPRTSFYWIKTTKNSTKSQIHARQIWGYFLGIFEKNSRDKIGDGGGQIRGNQELMIPYDET